MCLFSKEGSFLAFFGIARIFPLLDTVLVIFVLSPVSMLKRSLLACSTSTGVPLLMGLIFSEDIVYTDLHANKWARAKTIQLYYKDEH